MLEVLKAGGFTNGGLNFDAKLRRPSNTFEDIAIAYILGMDTYALGLINAAAIIEDGRLDQFVNTRYDSYNQGIGAKINAGETSLEELCEYALNLTEIKTESGRQEMLEAIMNQVMY